MVEIVRGGFYNYRNPPSSHEVALARLQELEVAVESISVQLEHTKPDKFETHDDFLNWKGRTMGAAGHYRNEVKYLERWIGVRGNRGDGAGGPQHVSGDQYRTSLEEVVASAQQMALQMRELYKRVYVEGHMPPDLATARKRREVLRDTEHRFQVFFKSLRSQAQLAGVGEDKILNLRKPMGKLLEDLKAELRLLSSFVDEQRGGRVDWTMFMLSLIERATTSGFKLSDDEKDVIEDIRDAKLASITRDNDKAN